MTAHTLLRWDTDAIAAWSHEPPTPADEPQARLALVGPVVAAHPALELIPTWAATTPPGTWVEVQVRVWREQAWEQLFRIATWDSAPSDSRRTSFAPQSGAAGQLATDTLLLSEPATGIQARVLLCAEPGADLPALTALTLCLTARAAPGALAPEAPSPTMTVPALKLPLLVSQFLSYPDHGPLWCSPTSLLMLLAYWHERTGLPELAPFRAVESVPAIVAPMVYDPGWEGTGNWAFNTAFAAALGLRAYVTRLHSLEQLARWTAAGVPVAISISWQPGELEGAVERSLGHITLVTGMAGERVFMVEPASLDPALIARSYRADQLYACWQRASAGTAYLIHPEGWELPKPGPSDAWV